MNAPAAALSSTSSTSATAAAATYAPVALGAATIAAESFWGRRRAVNRARSLPSQFARLESTHRLAALDPGWTGERHIFWDSDVAKWLEAAWSELASGGDDAALRAQAEQVATAFARAQQADGYVQSWFSFAKPEEKYRNFRDLHELYSMGHLLEALCAARENGLGGAGARAVAERLVDHLWREFGPTGKAAYCGHPEVELALTRWWRCSGDGRARELAALMVDRRGSAPHLYDEEARARGEDPRADWSVKLYNDHRHSQAHRPVREQTAIEGHAVRAVYLCTALADLAAAGDRTLDAPLKRLWESCTTRRMYVTGGLGSSPNAERFTHDYDLPDAGGYCETCAAIGLMRWAAANLARELRGEYGDIMELALHNAVISGVALDGEHYFYGNPLAVHPHDPRYNDCTPAARQGWYGCACCPPNISRTLAQLARFAYTEKAGAAAIHLYLPGAVRFAGLSLEIASALPEAGSATLRVTAAAAEPFALALRLPAWCAAPTVTIDGVAAAGTVRDGYLHLARVWRVGEVVAMALPMAAERVYAHPAVRSAAGRVAVRRGPVVYCAEEADNGEGIDDVSLRDGAAFSERTSALGGGCVALVATGERTVAGAVAGPLYRSEAPRREAVTVTLVPYAFWGNRGGAEMRVWLRR
jgi:DUF1680 family protein